jgi:hypothetical protein
VMAKRRDEAHGLDIAEWRWGLTFWSCLEGELCTNG